MILKNDVKSDIYPPQLPDYSKEVFSIALIYKK